jgi:KDO2-lipid IV(A) lauroyltransferase
VIGYYVFDYRKKVVLTNLRNAFPEKSEEEIAKIGKQFYGHFCDVMIETIKLLTISKKEFKKRCAMDEASIQSFLTYFNNNQSIIGVMGHCGNWEWAAIAHQVYFSRMITGVYHPLKNKSINTFMLNLRSRFGGDIVAMNDLLKRLIQLKQQGISTTVGLIADQTPPPEGAYWTTFLNQDTPIYYGPEKLAKRFNYPVMYLNIRKIKRGYYQLSTTLICEDPKETVDGEITEGHTRQLEKNIREQPFNWLWSHRRWKHKRPLSLIY